MRVFTYLSRRSGNIAHGFAVHARERAASGNLDASAEEPGRATGGGARRGDGGDRHCRRERVAGTKV